MINDTFKYRSTDVARYIVAYANENKVSINMTKLQKLLYIVYGTSLAIYGERLVDEHPQAWPYGPVFPTTRNKLLNVSFEDISLTASEFEEINKDERTKQIIKVVFDGFGAYNAGALTSWSHSPGSPWDRTTKLEGFKWGDRIDDETIQQYFNDIIIRKDGN